MDIQFRMTTFFLLIFYFIFLLDHVKAHRILAETSEDTPPSKDPISNSQPSLLIVIWFLSILFCLSLMILLYAKFRHRTSSSSSSSLHRIQELSRSQASGIDKKVVESLPFFRFSSLKGSREGLECAVCLARFQDIETLRLLPKCKHAFHIDCIDIWLEKHSTCPLCRQTIGADDLSQLPYSDSLRFLWLRDQESKSDSSVELHVEREENLHGSSRFSIGSISMRRLCSKGNKDAVEEELMPIQHDYSDYGDNKKACLNKLKHKINVVSDHDDVVVFKNQWSNMSSYSDLIMFHSSAMVSGSSSARFSSLDSRNNHYEQNLEVLNQNDKRSVSEITVHPRHRLELRNSDIISATGGRRQKIEGDKDEKVSPNC